MSFLQLISAVFVALIVAPIFKVVRLHLPANFDYASACIHTNVGAS